MHLANVYIYVIMNCLMEMFYLSTLLAQEGKNDKIIWRKINEA